LPPRTSARPRFAGTQATGEEHVAKFTAAVGVKVVYRPMTVDQMRASGRPLALGAANVRELNPELQTLDSWLAQHKCKDTVHWRHCSAAGSGGHKTCGPAQPAECCASSDPATPFDNCSNTNQRTPTEVNRLTSDSAETRMASPASSSSRNESTV
jgi:hypothetical protein